MDYRVRIIKNFSRKLQKSIKLIAYQLSYERFIIVHLNFPKWHSKSEKKEGVKGAFSKNISVSSFLLASVLKELLSNNNILMARSMIRISVESRDLYAKFPMNNII